MSVILTWAQGNRLEKMADKLPKTWSLLKAKRDNISHIFRVRVVTFWQVYLFHHSIAPLCVKSWIGDAGSAPIVVVPYGNRDPGPVEAATEIGASVLKFVDWRCGCGLKPQCLARTFCDFSSHNLMFSSLPSRNLASLSPAEAAGSGSRHAGSLARD